jgi:hypothetical protein
MITVDIKDGSLILKPQGLGCIWAMRGELNIPLSSVVSVKSVNEDIRPSGIRAPGLSLLTKHVGTFISNRDGVSFWDVDGRLPVLDIRLKNDENYQRIVIMVDDADDLAHTINELLVPATL